MPDFAEYIQSEMKIKKEVKSDFITYILGLRTVDQNFSFTTRATFYIKNIESGINFLIQERKALKNSCVVFPVFVEYAIVHPTLIAHDCSQKSCQTPVEHIDTYTSLTWFLESNFENDHKVFNTHLSQYEQWIIPLLINEHFTLAVVKLDKKSSNKFALIQYYDSCGDELSPQYQDQLKNFFKQMGFKVKYQCISEHDQNDAYNCGIFVTLKAIDIANSNIGNPERLLKKANNQYEYENNINKYRNQIGTLLKANGTKLAVSAWLQETLNNIEKICF